MSWYNPFSWGEDDNSMDDVQGYLAQIEPMLHQYYDPYINQGQAAMGTLDQQYQMLLNDPAAMQAMLGSGYTQSPGYQYNYNQAMNAGNMAAAAGGMTGTPAHEEQMMGTASGIASQDYWKYYGANQGLWNQGLQGTQDMFNTGFNASNAMASGLGSLYGNQANLAYGNMQTQNDMFASLLGAGMGAAGYALGGPGGYFAANAATNAMTKK